MNKSNRLTWIRGGAVIAPVLLIAILFATNRLAGPTKAHADPTKLEAGATSKASTDAKAAQDIETWIARNGQSAASPFKPAPIAATQTPVTEPSTQEEATPEPPPFDGAKLTGVFRSNDTTIAAINGKLFREGQVVSPGVIVTIIDVPARRVTLTLADGRRVELLCSSPTKRK
jgi:hypothetical protein